MAAGVLMEALRNPRLLFFFDEERPKVSEQLCALFSAAILLAELILNISIINFVPYTEIDWATYMTQVGVFVNGERNYTKFEGPTGPAVYPGGYIYTYSVLHQLTDEGKNVRRAQYIFAFIYLAFLFVVHRIYMKLQVPPFVLCLLSLSYRIHSIFSLRLFNDPLAMLAFYISLHFLLTKRTSLACIFFSYAVSIKMNVLLFAPGLLLVLLYTLGLFQTIVHLFICFLVQVLIALPFLFVNPAGYMGQAFDLGRVFLYEWTVNWRFVPEDIFLRRDFHLTLLALHLLVLLLFAQTKWTRGVVGFAFETLSGKLQRVALTPQNIVLMLFTSNLCGIAFSRSLHYQFYVWYFHSLPFILYAVPGPLLVKMLLFAGIEYSWNVFPSTCLSSGILVCCNVVLLGLLVCLPSQRFFPLGGSPKHARDDTTSKKTK